MSSLCKNEILLASIGKMTDTPADDGRNPSWARLRAGGGGPRFLGCAGGDSWGTPAAVFT